MKLIYLKISKTFYFDIFLCSKYLKIWICYFVLNPNNLIDFFFPIKFKLDNVINKKKYQNFKLNQYINNKNIKVLDYNYY